MIRMDAAAITLLIVVDGACKCCSWRGSLTVVDAVVLGQDDLGEEASALVCFGQGRHNVSQPANLQASGVDTPWATADSVEGLCAARRRRAAVPGAATQLRQGPRP